MWQRIGGPRAFSGRRRGRRGRRRTRWAGLLVGISVMAAGASAAAPTAAGGAVDPATTLDIRSVPGVATQLSSVACPTQTTCYSVGDSHRGGTLVAIHDGVPAGTELVRGTADLMAIACSGAKSCEAVGENAAQQGVALAVSGGAIGTPHEVGPQVYAMGSVACTTVAICEAGGADQGVLAQTKSGIPTVWEPVAHLGFFFSIACGSATTCEAVGENAAERGVLVRVVNGVAKAPRSERGLLSLAAIACPTATRCEAVGGFEPPHSHQGAAVTIINGVPGPIRLVRTAAYLSGVACPTVRRCEAVGDTPNGPGRPVRGVLVPISNGVPSPPEIVADVLTALACPSSTTCDAVGSAPTNPYRGFVTVLPVGRR